MELVTDEEGKEAFNKQINNHVFVAEQDDFQGEQRLVLIRWIDPNQRMVLDPWIFLSASGDIVYADEPLLKEGQAYHVRFEKNEVGCFEIELTET
jgi:hypothetical protein